MSDREDGMYRDYPTREELKDEIRDLKTEIARLREIGNQACEQNALLTDDLAKEVREVTMLRRLLDGTHAADLADAKCCECDRLREAIDRHIELTGRDPSERIVELEDQLVMAGSSETFLNGEIARLREAIQAWERYVCEATGCDPLAPLTHFPPEEIVLVKIAREGR